MVRTFQLTKALSRMTVMDNMMLGAQNQAGENLAKSLFKPFWGAQEKEIETKALGLLERFSLHRQAQRTTAGRSPEASASCSRWLGR